MAPRAAPGDRSRLFGRGSDFDPLWGLVAIVILVTAGWMAVSGLTLAWWSVVLPAAACIGFAALAAVARSRRTDPRLATCLTGASQFVGFSVAALCLSYAAAATAGPFWDDRLLGLDRALGLDWRAYLAFVDARPRLGQLYTLAYLSLVPQLLLVIPVLAFAGRKGALHRFLAAFMLTTLATILLSALVPAMAMYSALHLQPGDFSHLDPAAAYVHVAAMHGLRDGTLRVLSLTSLEGIVTFPSLHAASGVLLGLAFWSVPRLRWPLVGLNALLIAATPIDGGHYFTDVIAGCAIAILARRVVRPRVAGAGAASPAYADLALAGDHAAATMPRA